jgi:hypothetical protein
MKKSSFSFYVALALVHHQLRGFRLSLSVVRSQEQLPNNKESGYVVRPMFAFRVSSNESSEGFSLIRAAGGEFVTFPLKPQGNVQRDTGTACLMPHDTLPDTSVSLLCTALSMLVKARRRFSS